MKSKKIKNRILALILCITVIISLVPRYAYADDIISDTSIVADDNTITTEETEITDETIASEETVDETVIEPSETETAEAETVESEAGSTTEAETVENEAPAQANDESITETSAAQEETKAEAEAAAEILPGVANVLTKTILTSDNFRYKVTVSYDSTAGIPADAELSVKEITAEIAGINEDDIKDYIDQSAEALKLSLEEMSSVRLFDIALTGADGTEYQPNEKVAVSIELLGKDNETEDMRIVHFGDRPEELTAEVDNNVVSFETDGFSTFSLVDVTVLQRVINAVLGKNDNTLYENDDIVLTGKMPILGSVEATPVTVDIDGADALVAYDIKIYANPVFKALGITWQPTDGAITVTVKSDMLAGKTNALQIYHMTDVNGDAAFVTEAVPENSSVTFDADGFSIYAVVDGEPALRTYSFYAPDENGDYHEYYFMTDTGESVYQQTIKTVNGVTEPLVIPQLPSVEGSLTSTFAGWYVYDETTGTLADEPFDFNNIPEVTETEEIILRAKFSSYAYVIFHEQYNGSTQSWPIAGTRRGEITDGSASVVIDDISVTYDDNEHDSNAAPEMAFRGWSLTPVNPGASTDINGNPIQILSSPLSITENTDLYPVFVSINWLTFASGPTGSGATYCPPRYYYVDEGESDFPQPVRTGYTFDGWYTAETGGTKIVNADGTLAISGTVDSFTVVNGELRLTEDSNLYGHWNPAQTTYSVVIWRQKVTDEANLANSDKSYDYAESFSLTDQTGATVSVANAYKNYSGRGDYVGFTYSRCDDAKTVNADGSTVLNVYYDRNEWTLHFQIQDYVYTVSVNDNDNNPAKYGDVNGQKARVYWRNGAFRTTDNNNGPVYTGTVYTRSNNQSWQDIYTITAVYDHYIQDNFPIQGTNGVTYPGARWMPQNNTMGWNEVMVAVQNMPDGNVTFRIDNPNSRYPTKTMNYYVEALPGTEGTVTYNGRSFVLASTVQARYNGVTEEDFVDISGFSQFGWTDADGNSNPYSSTFYIYSNSQDQTINFFYTRNSYEISFMDSFTNSHVYVNGSQISDVSVPYESDIAGYLPDEPDAVQIIGSDIISRDGYNFTGWYADSACSTRVFFTEEEYNSSTLENKVLYDKMPANNLQLFAGWETEYYLIQLDPNGGELPEGYSLWFWEPYNGDPIEEYTTTTRHYLESLNGTYYYATKDRDYYGLGSEWDPIEDSITDRRAYYTTDVSDDAADLSTSYEYSLDAFRYAGWFEVDPETGEESLYAFGQPVMHDTYLRLHWKQIGTYYIRYDAGTGTLDDKDNNEESFKNWDEADYADHSDIVVTRTANPPEGYNFIGWTIRGGDGTVYYPGNGFEYQSKYAFTETIDGVEKKFLILDAVYSEIGSAKIIYDANGGSVDGTSVDYGEPTTEGAYSSTESDETTATLAGITNNTEVRLSSGAGFSFEGAEFRGWNTEPDGSGDHFDADANYYVDTEEPITLYAEWVVKVYFDKNNANADWGGNWDAVDENGDPIYIRDDSRNQYYTEVYINGTVDEPIYVPVSSNEDERFAYWSPVRYTDSGEVAYPYDFSTPIEEELTLYGFWANAIQVPYHVVDSSNEVLEEKPDWVIDERYFVVNTGTEIPLGTMSDTTPYVSVPSGYDYAFACVSDSLENCSEDNIITQIGYNTTTKRVSVTYTDGTTEDLPSGKEIYLIYFENPKTLNIGYKEMGTDGQLNEAVMNQTGYPTVASAGKYNMTDSVNRPVYWADNSDYYYYAYAIGDQNATNDAQLHLITSASQTDNTRPALQIQNTWRGFKYSTDGGNTWINCGYDIQLYVIYFESKPTVITLNEHTIGTLADMDEEFEYTVEISENRIVTERVDRYEEDWYGNWVFDQTTTAEHIVNSTTNIISEDDLKYYLKNGESETNTLFYSESISSVNGNEYSEVSWWGRTTYRDTTVTTTTITQTITITQTPATDRNFTTDNDSTAGTKQSVYVWTFTTTEDSSNESVTYTNTRTREDVELHIAIAQGGEFVADDSLRTEDAGTYTVTIPNGNTVNLSENYPEGLFVGDTDVYRFAGIIYGRNNGSSIDVSETGITSVSFDQLADSEYYGVYLNGDNTAEMEAGYDIYYVYYKMPKIFYMKEGTNGAITQLDQITRENAAVTMNGATVTQGMQLPVDSTVFTIDQSATGAYRVPPTLDGDKLLSLNYVKIGAGDQGAENTSELDMVSENRHIQLSVIDSQIKWSIDGTTWNAFDGDPTIYIIYKEKGYDLTINKVVTGPGADPERTFTVTVTSDLIEDGEYNVSGIDGQETVTAQDHMITLTVKGGSSITIHTLQPGPYVIHEENNSSVTMTAKVDGYSVTVTDNAFTVTLSNADRQAEITNYMKLPSPTGIFNDKKPYVWMMLLGGLLALLAIPIYKRRRRDDGDPGGGYSQADSEQPPVDTGPPDSNFFRPPEMKGRARPRGDNDRDDLRGWNRTITRIQRQTASWRGSGPGKRKQRLRPIKIDTSCDSSQIISSSDDRNENMLPIVRARVRGKPKEAGNYSRGTPIGTSLNCTMVT